MCENLQHPANHNSSKYKPSEAGKASLGGYPHCGTVNSRRQRNQIQGLKTLNSTACYQTTQHDTLGQCCFNVGAASQMVDRP